MSQADDRDAMLARVLVLCDEVRVDGRHLNFLEHRAFWETFDARCKDGSAVWALALATEQVLALRGVKGVS